MSCSLRQVEQGERRIAALTTEWVDVRAATQEVVSSNLRKLEVRHGAGARYLAYCCRSDKRCQCHILCGCRRGQRRRRSVAHSEATAARCKLGAAQEA